jgi:hypothetical protein
MRKLQHSGWIASAKQLVSSQSVTRPQELKRDPRHISGVEQPG